MIVITIVATLAGAVILSVGQTEAGVSDDLALADLNAVREAVRRFRQDTGFLPKTGAFGLPTTANPDRGVDAAASAAADGFSSAAAWEAAFASPANLSQLVRRPTLLPAVAHLAEWDPASQRGWRGPYLSGRLGLMLLGDGLDAQGNGNPLAGAMFERPLLALADAYGADRVSHAAPPFVWPTHAGAWFPQDWAGTGQTYESRRPLLLLQLEAPELARVVSHGPDGEYDEHVVPGDRTDPNYHSPVNPSAASDDVGLFLLR